MNGNNGPAMFGITRKWVPAKIAESIDAIAKEHGATFVGPVSIPGNDVRGWFEAPPMGSPFDDATARDVMAAVRKAGYGSYFPEPRPRRTYCRLHGVDVGSDADSSGHTRTCSAGTITEELVSGKWKRVW